MKVPEFSKVLLLHNLESIRLDLDIPHLFQNTFQQRFLSSFCQNNWNLENIFRFDKSQRKIGLVFQKWVSIVFEWGKEMQKEIPKTNFSKIVLNGPRTLQNLPKPVEILKITPTMSETNSRFFWAGARGGAVRWPSRCCRICSAQ